MCDEVVDCRCWSFDFNGFVDLLFLSPSAVYIGLTDDLSTSDFLLLTTHCALNDLVSTNSSDSLTIESILAG